MLHNTKNKENAINASSTLNSFLFSSFHHPFDKDNIASSSHLFINFYKPQLINGWEFGDSAHVYCKCFQV